MALFWFRTRNDIFNFNLSATKIVIFTYLSMLSNRDGHCKVRHNVIAQKTNTSRTTVIRALDELERLKLIEKITGSYGSNTYIVPSNMEKDDIIDRHAPQEKMKNVDENPGEDLSKEERKNIYYNWIDKDKSKQE